MKSNTPLARVSSFLLLEREKAHGLQTDETLPGSGSVAFFRNHCDTTTPDPPPRPVGRLFVDEHVVHGHFHMADIEVRVAAHQHLHILVVAGEACDVDVLKPSIGDRFPHFSARLRSRCLWLWSSGF